MFDNVKSLLIAAFGFGIKNTCDGPDDRLRLHDDPYYYFK